MPDTTTTRTAADAIADLDSLIQDAATQAIPVNLPKAIGLLVEHAKLSQHDDVSTLSARVDALDKLLTEAGIEQPAPAPAPGADTPQAAS